MPEAPQTMRQNWMPFFTFFLRRSFGPGMLLDDMLGVSADGGGRLGRVGESRPVEEAKKLDVIVSIART